MIISQLMRQLQTKGGKKTKFEPVKNALSLCEVKVWGKCNIFDHIDYKKRQLTKCKLQPI